MLFNLEFMWKEFDLLYVRVLRWCLTFRWHYHFLMRNKLNLDLLVTVTCSVCVDIKH